MVLTIITSEGWHFGFGVTLKNTLIEHYKIIYTRRQDTANTIVMSVKMTTSLPSYTSAFTLCFCTLADTALALKQKQILFADVFRPNESLNRLTPLSTAPMVWSGS